MVEDYSQCFVFGEYLFVSLYLLGIKYLSMSFHIYRKFLRSMEVVNVCVCVSLPEVTWRFHPIWWSGLTFFPLLLVMVVSAEVDWQMHARNPHSPFQRQHMMDCDLSAQQDTGTMQAVIGQVWSQPFLNSPFFSTRVSPYDSHNSYLQYHLSIRISSYLPA